jgi:hypothetical protein
MQWLCELQNLVVYGLDWDYRFVPWVQNSLNGIEKIRLGFSSYSSSNRLFWICFFVSLLLPVGLAFWTQKKSKTASVKGPVNDPEKLFWQLLNQVVLSESDKKLLHEMTREARLTHPATALLSPQNLDWARNLWIKEKGQGAIPREKLDRINAICVQLYDHYPKANDSDITVDSTVAV